MQKDEINIVFPKEKPEVFYLQYSFWGSISLIKEIDFVWAFYWQL
jgi:hypothetical protein